jgi:hypothetical protein
VFKHFTISELVEEFFPSEMERMAQVSLEELRALTSSILDGIVLWAVIAHHCQPGLTKEEYLGVSNALHNLYAMGIQNVMAYGPKPAFVSTSLVPTLNMSIQNDISGDRELSLQIDDCLKLLADQWSVTPQPFVSKKPYVGQLIVAFRTMVNNLASRWYVQPILEQQVAFNANVTNVVRMLTTQLQYYNELTYDQTQHNLSLVEQVAAMQQQLLLLASRVNQLEEKLDGYRENKDG